MTRKKQGSKPEAGEKLVWGEQFLFQRILTGQMHSRNLMSEESSELKTSTLAEWASLVAQTA